VAIKVRLRPQRAEYLAAALAYGRPIEPDNNAVWSPNDAVVLAGAGLYAALRHGPRAYHGAVGRSFKADFHAAVEWVAAVLARTAEGKYEDHTGSLHASQVVVAGAWPIRTRPIPSPPVWPPCP